MRKGFQYAVVSGLLGVSLIFGAGAVHSDNLSYLGGMSIYSSGFASVLSKVRDAQPMSDLASNTGSAKHEDLWIPFLKPRVRVVSFGSGVTSADVTRVQNMLTRVNSVERISQFLGVKMNRSAKIILVNNAASYSQALKNLGVSSGDASNLSEDSNGFTLGSTVIVPLFQNTSDAELTNTLTHELTHVDINQHIQSIPSWMNEGMAVFMGMNGQRTVETPIGFQDDELGYTEDILSVTQTGELVPLTGDESAILSGSESYDYELQDWLAMCDLISKYGFSSIQTLVSHLEHENADQSFEDTFGESVKSFNSQFTKVLKSSLSAPNDGASVQLTIAPSFSGDLLFQGPNESSLQGVIAKPGSYQFVVKQNGRVSSALPPTPIVKSENPSSSSTMYLSVIPSKVDKVQESRVTNGGLSFSLENGLYTFDNAWINLANGTVVDESSPSVLGVTVEDVNTLDTSDPILNILKPEEKTV